MARHFGTDMPREVAALETRVARAFERLVSVAPLVDGQLHDVTISAGGTATVEHKLQRAPVGWIVVYRTAAAELTAAAADITATSITFTEAATVAATLKVWVF